MCRSPTELSLQQKGNTKGTGPLIELTVAPGKVASHPVGAEVKLVANE